MALQFYITQLVKSLSFNPVAKIVMVLRNPVDRGFSHYLMDKRLGFVNATYEEIVHKKTTDKKLNLYYQQYISLGLYYEQICRYMNLFAKNSVKIFLYEEVVGNIGKVVEQLYQFLEVDDTFKPDIETRHNVFEVPKNRVLQKLYTQKAFRTATKKIFTQAIQNKVKSLLFSKENKPVLSQQLKHDLMDIYREDMLKTSALIDKDLTSWVI